MTYLKTGAIVAVLLTVGAFSVDAEAASAAVRACCDLVAACCGQGKDCCP